MGPPAVEPVSLPAPSAVRLSGQAGHRDDNAGRQFFELIQPHLRRTHGPRVFAEPPAHTGLFRLDYNEGLFKRNFKDPVLVSSAAGIGAKAQLAGQMRRFDTIGVDLVAMCVNDLVVHGAEPLLVLDHISCDRIEPSILEPIVRGMADACRQVGAALIGGQTTERPDQFGPGELDLAGFALGVVELRRAMDPERVEPGDIVVGLESDGVHAAGFDLVQQALQRGGVAPDEIMPGLDAERPIGDVLLTPTRLYADPIVRTLRKYRVKKIITAMAHITDGGFVARLGAVLPGNVSAQIDSTAWRVPPVFRTIAELGGVCDVQMRERFNMGLGYCLIVRPAFADSIVRRLARLGERPHVIGQIVRGDGTVHVRGW